MKKLSWSNLKSFLSGRKISLQYLEFENHYHVIAIDGKLEFYCDIAKINPTPDNSDQKDFEDNFKDDCNTQLQDNDMYGRNIVRYAATIKGWHYQAHSVQFEVNKFDSIYNKDHLGNDLGFTDIKIYKSNGSGGLTECTNQADADVYGIKTVISWKPNFDFEIISGNVRQITKETVDSYLYVNANVYTGLDVPNDYLRIPFVQGGINLNYIGADEPLKTDGRASKLLKGTNADYLEIVVNYDADLLTNENRHKMSILFEIYKDPTS